MKKSQQVLNPRRIGGEVTEKYESVYGITKPASCHYKQEAGFLRAFLILFLLFHVQLDII